MTKQIVSKLYIGFLTFVLVFGMSLFVSPSPVLAVVFDPFDEGSIPYPYVSQIEVICDSLTNEFVVHEELENVSTVFLHSQSCNTDKMLTVSTMQTGLGWSYVVTEYDPLLIVGDKATMTYNEFMLDAGYIGQDAYGFEQPPEGSGSVALADTFSTTTTALTEVAEDGLPKVLVITAGLTGLAFLLWKVRSWIGRK